METKMNFEIVENVETFEKMLARVREAQKIYASYTQEQVDKIFRAAAMAAKVGRTLECICDGVDDETGMYLLRTAADCPEIDGNVLTPADTPLETGAFYRVTVTDADTYDLYGYVEEKLED